MADYISRDDVLKAIDYQHEVNNVFESEAAYVQMWETINDDIGIKSADVQPIRHGQWTDNVYKYVKSLDAYFIQAKCSVCGRYSDRIDIYSRFMSNECCSRCGARMDGDTK